MNNKEIMQACFRRSMNVDCIIDGKVLDEDGESMTRAEALKFLNLTELTDAERVLYCERQVRTSSHKSNARESWGTFHRKSRMVKSRLDDYLSLRHKRLAEQVRRARKQEEYRRERADDAGDMAGEMGGLVHDVPDIDVDRISTGLPGLDKIFGANLDDPDEIGLPVGITVLIGGEYGVGKTRLLVYMAALMSRPGVGHRVLYQQGEMGADLFVKNYVRNTLNGDEELYVYGDKSLSAQVDRMYEVMPKLVIVDSLQMIAEATNERGAQRVHDTMLQVAREIDATVMFISHLNAQGEIKGGTKIPHMVDVVLTAKKLINPQQFSVSCPKKNRFGATGISACFEHTSKGIVPFTLGKRNLSGSQAIVTIKRPAVGGDNALHSGGRIIPRSDGQPVAAVEDEEVEL